jgi:hypothetical protein
MKKIGQYEIVDHGIENSQYFQGCGVAFTEYTDVATGIGEDYAEAVDDACEMLAQNGWDTDCIDSLPQRGGRGPCVPDDAEDCYYYVSIRVRE